MNYPLELSFYIIALFRVILQFTKFNFNKLPITKAYSLEQFHKYGFYISLGYVIFATPSLIYY